MKMKKLKYKILNVKVLKVIIDDIKKHLHIIEPNS